MDRSERNAVWAEQYRSGKSLTAIARDWPASSATVYWNLKHLEGFTFRAVGRRKLLSDAELLRRSTSRFLKRNYGIGIDEYEQMVSAQGGTCAICKSDSGSQRLHVDHDHATGVIRALLCRGCNASLGLMKDNPELLRAAASYLEAH